MKLTKKILSIIVIWIIWIWFSLAIDFPYSGINSSTNDIDTDFSNILKESIDNNNTNWIPRLLNMFMPNTTIYMWENWPSVLFYLKTIVNLLLSFVSLIALILTIYAFYMIFFKKDDAGISMAKQMLKWIAIALVVIALSRIIVSFLYRFENQNTQLSHHQTPMIQSNIV